MLTAVIDPQACIGCGICLEQCPFDAIIGAVNQMHTVIVEECIGCKLCVEPCPVDCIQLLPLSSELAVNKKHMVAKAKKRRAAKISRISQEQSINLIDRQKIAEDLENLRSNNC